MVRWLFVGAIALALIVISGGAQALNTPFFERSNGAFGYVVQESDDLGQWQIALGNGRVWAELVRVNPQLADPNRIMPGDTLNVPASLARTFQLLAAVDSAGVTPLVLAPKPDTANAPPPVVEGRYGMSGIVFLLCVLGAALALWLLYRFGRSRERTRQEAVRAAERSAEATQRANEDSARRLADPFSGHPVRENGLPSIEAAEAFFAETYRSTREGMTVAANAALPPLVTIDRIRAVDVRGSMMVTYRTGQPERRDVPNWTPAWQAFFSDGTFRITLMRCANDVRGGGGMTALPETQIRPRTDIPERVFTQQVWPPVPEGAAPVETASVISETVENYTSVKVSSPTRFVLHRAGGPETVIDLGVLAPFITLGLEGGEIYAVITGQRRLIGRLVIDEAAIETARKVDEIVAHAGTGAAS